MAPFTITVLNSAAGKQSFAVFAEAPVVDQPVKVRTHIIVTARNVPGKSGRANFILSKDLYATCGTSDVGADGVDTGTEVLDQQRVQLAVSAEKSASGKSVLGTRLEVDCSDDTPCFSASTESNQVDDGCFAIRTKNDFTSAKAYASNYLIGLSSSENHSAGPFATFTPRPDTTFQIKPPSKFYVVAGDFEPRAIVDPAILAKKGISVDSRRFPSNQAILKYDHRGNFRLKNFTPGPAFPPSEPTASSGPTGPAQDYEITITNGSGTTQHYALLTEVTGSSDKRIGLFSTSHCPTGETAAFTIANKAGAGKPVESSTATVFFLVSTEEESQVRHLTIYSAAPKLKIDFANEAPTVSILQDAQKKLSFQMK